MSIDKIREVANLAAFSAGKILEEKLGNLKSIDYKSAFNIVTDADRASEKEIIRIIHNNFPEHAILGEETASENNESKEIYSKSNYLWIIDPLDGTTNYTHSYPFFAVSIGFESEGKRIFGLVYNPISKEKFHAEINKGAWLEDKEIKVSTTNFLGNSLLSTGFPPDTKTAKLSNLKEFAHLTDLSHGVRRDGSASLDLCFVACGRFDGFWEYKLAPWDLAAGTLIVEEAGGKVTSPQGKHFEINSGHVLASNGLIHDQIISALDEVSLQF